MTFRKRSSSRKISRTCYTVSHALSLPKHFAYHPANHSLAQDYAKAVRHALGRRDTPTDEIKAFGNSVIAYLKDHLIPEFDRYEFYTVPSYRSNSL